MAARKNSGSKDSGKKAEKQFAKDAKKGGGPATTPRTTDPAPVVSEKKHTPAPSVTTPAGAMSEATARAAAAASPRKPSHEEIARRAYELWCAEGKPDGRERDHWLAAERSLIVEMKPGATRPVRL